MDAASKVRDNAEQLYSEARILRAAGALARSLFLHQISLEECAKVDMLGAWAVSQQLTGETTDSKKFWKALASHKAKNSTNAYLMPATEAERRAREAGDWSAAIQFFLDDKTQFHNDSNTAKNAALYVDVREGFCSTPVEQISESMVKEIVARNERFLTHANTHVRVLARWVESPAEFVEINRWFVERAKELQDLDATDPEQIVSTLLEDGHQKHLELLLKRTKQGEPTTTSDATGKA
ncbi:MAG: AbiV family abortive infection protein [Phycisphaerales bacterium]